MIAVAPLAISLIVTKQATTYKIVEIERHAVFAGKLGDLVHEALVVERDGNRYTITIEGDYHTACLHEKQRFHKGDTIRLGSPISGNTTIDRDRVGRG
jgi:transketolase C-terminal domain/subunit